MFPIYLHLLQFIKAPSNKLFNVQKVLVKRFF